MSDPRSPEACLSEMLRFMRTETQLAPTTVQFYEQTVHAVFAVMRRAGAVLDPELIERKDVKLFLDRMDSEGLARNTQKGYLFALRKLTEHYGNYTIKHMSIRWPADSRPNVDWLTAEQAKVLLDATKTPLQELGIHLMLCMGLRRIEVLRIKPGDIHDTYLTVTGKGTMGGKLRNVPFHRDTLDIICRYNQHRKELIDAARARYPTTTVIPEEYVIRNEHGVLKTYEIDGWGWDKTVIKPLNEDLGFHFSNHTLRRTFGRMMYRSGAPVATIAKILGHESTDMTLRYIGVDLDDMSAAMRLCPI